MYKVKSIFSILLFFVVLYFFSSPPEIFAAISTCQSQGVSINPTQILENSTPPVNFSINGNVFTPGDVYKLSISTKSPGQDVSSGSTIAQSNSPLVVGVFKNGGLVDNTLDSGNHTAKLQTIPLTNKSNSCTDTSPGSKCWQDFCTGLQYNVGYSKNSCQASVGGKISFQNNESINFSVQNAPAGTYKICFGTDKSVSAASFYSIYTGSTITVDNNGNGNSVIQPFIANNTPQTAKFVLVNNDSSSCEDDIKNNEDFCYLGPVVIGPNQGKPAPISCTPQVSGNSVQISCLNLTPNSGYSDTISTSGVNIAGSNINSDGSGNATFNGISLSQGNYSFQVIDSSSSVVANGTFTINGNGIVGGPGTVLFDSGKPSNSGLYCDLNNGGKPFPPGSTVVLSDKLGILTAIGCIPTDSKAFINQFLKFALGAAGGIALLIMGFGAFQMITAAGNAEAVKAGRDRFTSAIMGLVFVIFAVFLLQVIGVKILSIPGFG